MSKADRILLGGAPEGFDAKLLAREAERGTAVIHIARDDKRMEAMRAALAVMAPGLVVLELPAWDCLPYDRVSPNPEILAQRMSTLATLTAGLKPPFVLLTTLNAATQRLPAREVMRGASFAAAVGDRVDEAAFARFSGADGVLAGLDSGRGRGFRDSRRHHRYLSAGQYRTGAAGFLWRHAGRGAAL